MRSIVRRDTEESYQEFLTGLAEASGIETPTARTWRAWTASARRKPSKQDWKHPWDPDAKVVKMKVAAPIWPQSLVGGGLETGPMVAVTPPGADQRDATTMIETAIAAEDQIEDAPAQEQAPQTLQELIGRRGLS
jgi:transposase